MAQRIGRAHFVFDEWSRRGGPLHAIEARVKLVATLALLVATSVWAGSWRLYGVALLLMMLSRAPFFALAARAALVVPFTVLFAALTWWSGDGERAAALVWRTYLSALWVAVLMAVTPLETVLEAAARMGAPRLVVEVMHFTWRYIGVMGEQAWRMRTAARARGAERSFEVSASSLAVLFASSYARAERIHRAQMARGVR